MSNIQLYNEENTADLALREQVLTEIREYDSFNCNMKNWVSLDIPSLRRKINFLEGKDVILCTVNKDLINFIKMRNIFKKEKEFNVIAIFDITLDYRPNIKSILEKTLKDYNLKVPVFTNMRNFFDFCVKYQSDNGGIDNSPVCIKFDHSGADIRQRKNINVHFNSAEFDTDEFEKHIKERYEIGCKAKKKHSNEFVYMMEFKDKLFLNSWIVWKCGCYITDCYGDTTVLLLDDGYELQTNGDQNFNTAVWLATRTIRYKFDSLESIEFDENVNLYELQNSVKDTKVRFVFSSDFGGGKTSYILQKSPNKFLTKDLFTAWFNSLLYYGPGGVDSYTIPEVRYIFNALCRWKLTDNTDPIYIKMEGRLDRYFFHFLRGEGSLGDVWSFFHLFFKDYEFHIIIKEDENLSELARDLVVFIRTMLIDINRVRLFKSINHCERFEEIDTKKVIEENADYYTETIIGKNKN